MLILENFKKNHFLESFHKVNCLINQSSIKREGVKNELNLDQYILKIL